MDRTLTSFVAALRNAEVRISPAETLDAMRTIELVGYRDRAFLKDSLALALPKTADEKETYDATFDRFFQFHEVASGPGAGAANGEGSDNGAGQPQAESQSGGGQSAAGGGDAGAGDELLQDEDLGPGEMATPRSELGRLLMRGDTAELMVRMAEAAQAAKLEEISVFTQKGLYTRKIMEAMGLAGLDEEIRALATDPHLPERRLGQALRQRRAALREQVRDYVERQFLLHADVHGRRLREDMLRKVKLSNVEHRNFRLMQEVVLRMAKRLAALHSRRRKVFKRGRLDVPRTLRRNMGQDGALFNLQWKSVRVDRPRVFAICDVSGSVAQYARFMLMFLYSLGEVMPKVRAFAFSSDLAEVTELFERNTIEDAIAKTLRDYAGGSTDYGQAFADFQKLCMDDVDNRTTIVILGDARNNYGDPRADILKELYDRAKRVLWLNPESRVTWNTGDAEMRKYSACVHQAVECNSLTHLNRVVGDLLRSVA